MKSLLVLLVSFLIENRIILCPSGLNKYTSTQLSGRVCDYNARVPEYDFPMPQKKANNSHHYYIHSYVFLNIYIQVFYEFSLAISGHCL